MNKRPQGAVIYTRVSTGEQAEHGTSLSSQSETCQVKAKQLNLPVVSAYEDAGVSGGFLLSRPGVQSAIADITSGRASHFICANISRFSRDREHQSAIKKAIEAAGGKLVICDMNLDDSEEAELCFNVTGDFEVFRKKIIRKETMKGRRKRAVEGSQPVRTTSPFGYHVVTIADVLRGEYVYAQLGKYVFVEPQKSVALDMWTWYAEGRYSLAGIAKHLNQHGVPTPRRAKQWCVSTIRNILTNPVYKGTAYFGKIEKRLVDGRKGQINPTTGRPIITDVQQKNAPEENWVAIDCPPLVTEEVWDSVQQRLKDGRQARSGNPQRVRMLASRVYCPDCGGAMNFVPAKKSAKGFLIPENYTCLQHARQKRLTGEFVCNAKTYRVSEAQEAASLAILQAVVHPEWIEVALEKYRQLNKMRREVVDFRKELDALDRGLKHLEAEEAAAVQAQISGIMAGASAGAYAEVFATIAARRKDMEDRRGVLVRASKPQKAAGMSDADLATVLSDVHRALASPFVTDTEKRDLVGRVIEKVICQKGGADVIFHCGLFGEVCNETLQTERTVSIGDLSSSIVHPREVFKDAVVISAAALIVAHNHPSGDPTPSAEDVAVTKRLIGAGEIMGIDLLDHIVIGDGVFVSLKERGLI